MNRMPVSEREPNGVGEARGGAGVSVWLKTLVVLAAVGMLVVLLFVWGPVFT